MYSLIPLSSPIADNITATNHIVDIISPDLTLKLPPCPGKTEIIDIECVLPSSICKPDSLSLDNSYFMLPHNVCIGSRLSRHDFNRSVSPGDGHCLLYSFIHGLKCMIPPLTLSITVLLAKIKAECLQKLDYYSSFLDTGVVYMWG